MFREVEESALIERTRNGDRDAFEVIYHRYKSTVWGRCSRYLRDVQAAEDAQQETFFKVSQAMGGYRPSGTFRAWVLSICSNVCVDQLRRSRRQVGSVALEGVFQSVDGRKRPGKVDGALQRADNGRRPGDVDAIVLRDVVAKLPQDEREAWLLIEVRGFSSGEAATIVGADAPSTMRSRKIQARTKIARALTEGC